MRVEFTPESRLDLRDILAFIASDSPARALSFVDELTSACLSLSESPKRYPLVFPETDTGIRRRVHGNYLIFYRIRETVQIIRVLNSAMDYEPLLFPKS